MLYTLFNYVINLDTIQSIDIQNQIIYFKQYTNDQIETMIRFQKTPEDFKKAINKMLAYQQLMLEK